MNQINQAVMVLNQGGIIIYPTDTAFGIGCRIDNIEAIYRLFQIRKRPPNMPTSVLVSSIPMAQGYLAPLPLQIKNLMEIYWPGGLTIVYNCLVEKVPEMVRAFDNSLGVRMPDHKLTLQLIKQVGVPILGPSANFHGFPTPYSISDLDPELVKLVDLVLPGEVKVSEVSTLVDCMKTPWKILRKGSVKIDISRFPL